MALTVGTRLGSYEILSAIGAGGMGEVYRARDTKLKRDVALKVLPDAFADNADRMARFRREAEVPASLNHPNIAQVYGVEDCAIVMELANHERRPDGGGDDLGYCGLHGAGAGQGQAPGQAADGWPTDRMSRRATRSWRWTSSR